MRAPARAINRRCWRLWHTSMPALGNARGGRDTRRTGKFVAAPVCLALLACLVHAGLGDGARALELLDRAGEERDVWLTWLGVEPRFDTLRGEPRLKELMRRVGL